MIPSASALARRFDPHRSPSGSRQALVSSGGSCRGGQGDDALDDLSLAAGRTQRKVSFHRRGAQEASSRNRQSPDIVSTATRSGHRSGSSQRRRELGRHTSLAEPLVLASPDLRKVSTYAILSPIRGAKHRGGSRNAHSVSPESGFEGSRHRRLHLSPVRGAAGRSREPAGVPA
jgi:hypothetical protein